MKQKIFLLSALLIPLLNFASEYENVAKLMTADNTFAFKLLKELNAENKSGNLFFSPYSTATALQMAANGASGQTKAEMQKVLETAGFTREALNAASKAAAALLNAPDTNIILTTANALWYRQSAEIRPEFLAENQKFFASTIKPLDFANVPAAEAAINQWASDQTRGRITGFANGLIDPLYTDLVLANAIYFKGKWLDQFDAKLTKERPFHSVTGKARDVPMMEKSKSFRYHKAYGYQAVRLPYQGGDLAMYVFLTDTNYSPETLVQNLDAENWRRVTLTGFSDHDGLVVLPKFKLENTFDLKPPLQKLGLKTAFDQNLADFTGMFKDPHFISAVREKTFVEVSEEGTEAAAVTAPIPTLNGEKETPFQMIVDRPFLFTIVDARSETILFMGVVNEL